MEPYANLNRVLEHTVAEGPGNRFCLWTQGCLKRCPGCCNAAMRELRAELLLPVQEVCRQIRFSCGAHGIEGITLLGGEPFLQARSLTLVARFAHSLGLNVLAFSGYEREFLEAPENDAFLPGCRELLAECDVLIDGPYLRDFPDTRRNWVGSANQRFHYLTSVYGPEIETSETFRHIVELRIHTDSLAWNGCPKTLADIPEK